MEDMKDNMRHRFADVKEKLNPNSDPTLQDKMGFCWSIVWIIIFLVVALPVGLFCAIGFVLLSPFAACTDKLTPTVDLLKRGLKFPKTCARNMVDQKPLF
jgi:ABC-type phosphate transport system permease subunit